MCKYAYIIIYMMYWCTYTYIYHISFVYVDNCYEAKLGKLLPWNKCGTLKSRMGCRNSKTPRYQKSHSLQIRFPYNIWSASGFPLSLSTVLCLSTILLQTSPRWVSSSWYCCVYYTFIYWKSNIFTFTLCWEKKRDKWKATSSVQVESSHDTLSSLGWPSGRGCHDLGSGFGDAMPWSGERNERPRESAPNSNCRINHWRRLSKSTTTSMTIVVVETS